MSFAPVRTEFVAKLLAPAVASIIALAILLGLGFWQLDRKAWQEGLIRQIESRAYGAPGSPAPESSWPAWRADQDEFRRVELEGTFLPDAVAIHGLAEVRRGQAAQGFYLFTPFRQADGSIVIVNRGFVTTEARMSASEIPGPNARVFGLVRAPETRGLFMPENDPGRDSWWVRSVADIARARHLERVAPFYVDADATPNPGGWPRGGQTQLTLRNNHLEYALTWFGLAGTLLGVFAAFAWKQGREAMPDPAEVFISRPLP